MSNKKESIKTWKTAKTSKKFNKAVKRAATSAANTISMGTYGMAESMVKNLKTKKMQKRNKSECVKSGGVWVKGACKAKSKFKPGAKVKDPISKR